MTTLSERFVDESARLGAYRGLAEDNGGVEPQYPNPSEVDALFHWTKENTDNVRSVLPQDRGQHYGDWGITSVITFTDGSHATIHSAWMEDQIDLYEGTEDREFDAEPGEILHGIATLHPAGQSGMMYFDRMANLQHGPKSRFGPDFAPAIARETEAAVEQ